jgi:hypothetical protein
MYSIENFYYILLKNLFEPAGFNSFYFYPFGSVGSNNLMMLGIDSRHGILHHDQEPLLQNSLNYVLDERFYSYARCKLLANSEYSVLKKNKCKELDMIDFYYFYHGFASLYWFNDWKYLPNTGNNFYYPFINLNNLTVNDRSYRLLLVAKMISNNLHEKGLISLNLRDKGYGTWQEELNDPNSKLPKDQLSFINDQIEKINFQSLTVDTNEPTGALSAAAGNEEFELNQKALWHVVSETVFYYDKLHLTEKIFKPIASKRPFILVAAPGNLQYLKSYGFKTFNKWIDESYDCEKDNNLRLEKIVTELVKISKLSKTELQIMHREMQEILDFNFNHFYGEFKNIITRELIDNFKSGVGIYNNGLLISKYRVNLAQVDFEKTYKILTQ